MNFTAMRLYFARVLAIGVLIGSACAEAKADVVYNMAVSDGTEAVTGTLTTNGATGTLVAADVLGWDLTAAGKGRLHAYECRFSRRCSCQCSVRTRWLPSGVTHSVIWSVGTRDHSR